MSDNIVGVIFPVPEQYIERVFTEKKDIFVKYSKMNKLTIGSKVLFYSSPAKQIIVGEAKIEKIEFLSPTKINEKYKKRLFLNSDEFNNYIKATKWGDRGSKPLLVLSLNDIKRYKTPIKTKDSITVAGRYIRYDEYVLLQKQSE